MVETSHTAIPTRDQIAIEDTWDLSTIFPSDEAWESEYETVRPAIDRAAAFRGRLAEGAPVVKEAIDAVFALQLSINRLAVYASLRKDENTTDTEAISRYERAIFASIQAGEALAFLEPELLALSAETLGSYAAADELSSYRFMLQDLERRRPHVRSEEVEEVLAQLADVSRASSDAFGALDNADISFGEIEDEDGNMISLSKARYGKLIESPNRDVRQRAFKAMAAPYLAHANTLASLHGSSVRKDVASARVRGHNSALEEALFGDNLPESVYHGLIDVVRENTPLLERSLALRKRALGLDKLERFDLRVPLSKEPRRVYDYREAVDVVLAGVSALGERYTNDLRNGFNSRWVDVHETQNKRSGAYSWGVYGSPPVMLMNWNGTISDVYTLAHEAGHAMHTYYANEAQEFHNAGYPIFLAEIASTVNEVLLTWHLLGTEEGAEPQTRFSLLNRFVEGFEGTIANQTMYAEFELRTHTAAEEGRPLTREYLTEQFGDVQSTYAPGVGVNEESAIHWARVPHFYRAFYVFKYATGLAAAISIARAVRDEGEPARERYLEMLVAGGSDYPLTLLQNAGVDLSTPEPIRVAFEEYELVLAEMERLADEGVLDDGSGER
jgi:oligoendopeptidase F